MKKEYELVSSGTGDINVIYYIDGILETIEYYSKEDGTCVAGLKDGYILKVV